MERLQADEGAFVARILTGVGAEPANFENVIAVNEGRADPLDLEAGPGCRAAG